MRMIIRIRYVEQFEKGAMAMILSDSMLPGIYIYVCVCVDLVLCGTELTTTRTRNGA